MTDKQKLELALQNQKNLEKRVVELEEQMAICLQYMRVRAEKEAKEKDKNFKVHENHEA